MCLPRVLQELHFTNRRPQLKPQLLRCLALSNLLRLNTQKDILILSKSHLPWDTVLSNN